MIYVKHSYHQEASVPYRNPARAEMHRYLLTITRAEFDALLARANRQGRPIADVFRDFTRRVEREEREGPTARAEGQP